jgi:hypothetical protein
MNKFVIAALALVTVAVSAPAFAGTTPGELMHYSWLGR